MEQKRRKNEMELRKKGQQNKRKQTKRIPKG